MNKIKESCSKGSYIIIKPINITSSLITGKVFIKNNKNFIIDEIVYYLKKDRNVIVSNGDILHVILYYHIISIQNQDIKNKCNDIGFKNEMTFNFDGMQM